MPFTQENRFITIDTPLGADVLLLTRISGTEGLSYPFSYSLDLISENHKISFKDIIGKNVTVSLVLANGEKRFINGIVSCFSQGRGGGEEGGGDTRFSHYTAEVVPWLWLLTRTADSRIFQGLSVPDIIEKIFTEKKLLDYKIDIQGSYAKWDYCVQYRETDFNFVSRLMEEEGIFYFFQHEEGKHTLVLADVPEKHKPCPNQETARYQISQGGFLEEDTISGIEITQEIQAGKYTLNDFNFETPNTNLQIEIPGRQTLGPGEREIYDYPGGYEKRAGGEQYAKIRMQEEEAAITNIRGLSNCRSFISGYKFDLQDFYRGDMNDKSYVLTSVHHEASQEYSPGETESAFSYSNNFSCIPLDTPFRPRRNTPKPFVQGAQTAIVVGPAGEEIYTDKYGRVKVQFHWDREGKKNENSSCWIRVSQAWAGTGWGAMYIPRIGHEVIVDFLEGDPDRPIITGRVYHANNMPPYGLPGEKTKSTIKSNSSLGGGGSNEFRFEDKKGSEEIFLHGQKDWTIAIENDKNQTVGHNETLTVGNNRDKSVGVDQSEKIGSNKTINVGVNHTEVIGANMSLTVGSNKTETVSINTAETIGVAKELTIGAAYQVSVGAAMNETIGAAKAEEIGATKSVNVGVNSSENVGADKSVEAGGNISESAGKKMSFSAGDDFSIAGQKKGVIEIKDQLTIKCGSASIIMKKNGEITIEGKNINVKGSGKIVMKANKILEN
ncbi:MAG TPA: type VI secretion system tip protein TssI/VgrG [Nitrospirota bacterium]|nr:type VI secretion system tip protein TssI/VgrG [Nitrospirota bacterium]